MNKKKVRFGRGGILHPLYIIDRKSESVEKTVEENFLSPPEWLVSMD
jgi:hypothetical protein